MYIPVAARGPDLASQQLQYQQHQCGSSWADSAQSQQALHAAVHRRHTAVGSKQRIKHTRTGELCPVRGMFVSNTVHKLEVAECMIAC